MSLNDPYSVILIVSPIPQQIQISVDQPYAGPTASCCGIIGTHMSCSSVCHQLDSWSVFAYPKQRATVLKGDTAVSFLGEWQKSYRNSKHNVMKTRPSQGSDHVVLIVAIWICVSVKAYLIPPRKSSPSKRRHCTTTSQFEKWVDPNKYIYSTRSIPTSFFFMSNNKIIEFKLFGAILTKILIQ
jgi:hypothetical protein